MSGHQYQFVVFRSSDNEEMFFAKMGKFFASTSVRNEMGGSALSDLPTSHWLTFYDELCKVRAFLLVEWPEKAKHIRIKDGYVEPEHRGQQLLQKLIGHAVDIAKQNEIDVVARVRKSAEKYFKPYKFKRVSETGDWVNLEKTHAAPGRKKAQS